MKTLKPTKIILTIVCTFFLLTSLTFADEFWSGAGDGNISNSNTGNVGIGTTTPGAKLTIEQSGGDYDGLRLRKGTNYWDLYTSGSNLWISLNEEDQIVINDEGNIDAGGFSASGGKILVGQGIDSYSQFGPTPEILIPQDKRDRLAVIKQTDTKESGVIRGLTTWSESTATEGEIIGGFAGLNSFGHSIEDNAAYFSRDNAFGGLSGGRYVVRHNGTGNVELATGISTYLLNKNGGEITTWVGSNSEGPDINQFTTVKTYNDFKASTKSIDGTSEDIGGGTVNTRNMFYGADWVPSTDPASTFGKQYGIHIEELNGALNNYAIALTGKIPASGIYFNSDETSDTVYSYIYAGDTGNVDINASQRINLNNNTYINGNVGIGTTCPQTELTVNGVITAKDLKITTTGAWCDYVFDDDYKLLSLNEVEKHIMKNKHLPDIPPAKKIEEDGLTVSDILAMQMRKIEELTLYLIEMQKENDTLRERMAALEEKN